MDRASGSIMDRLVEALIDGIISFTDYFIIQKHVTLSEGVLFALSFVRAVWFTAFGVNLGPMPGPLTHEAWTPVFWLLSVFHVIAFFRSTTYRIVAMGLYGFTWCFLAILVALSTFSSPAFPTFMTFAVLSVFIAFRFARDRTA